MIKLVLISLFISLQLYSFCQSHDFISVRKKNGRIVKTFTAGSIIDFKTSNGIYFSGPIEAIRHDSAFIYIYRIESVYGQYGGIVPDTGTFHYKIHYRDIAHIKVFKRDRFIRGKIDRLLMFGGAGYIGLNVVNGIINHEQINDHDNLVNLGIAAGAVGTGILLKKYFSVNRYTRKRHKIVYVNMQ